MRYWMEVARYTGEPVAPEWLARSLFMEYTVYDCHDCPDPDPPDAESGFMIRRGIKPYGDEDGPDLETVDAEIDIGECSLLTGRPDCND